MWARVRFKYNYWILSDTAGDVSFAVIGNPTGRNPYCRTYIQQRDTAKVIARWYDGSETIAAKLIAKYGMVVLADVPIPAAMRDQSLIVPNFISLAIKLNQDLPTYLKGISASMRSNIRLLEKRNFNWQISKDPAWAVTYYRHYFRPTMLQSHGDEAYIYPESIILTMVQEPGMEFLQIFEGEKIVGAALCQNKNETYHIINLGWLEGDIELRKKGVPSAFFWYAICHSFEIGCKLVNCGGSPPYLENGVTRFKMPWGLHIVAIFPIMAKGLCSSTLPTRIVTSSYPTILSSHITLIMN